MSAISGYINTIRNAVYGEQVRGAIISALEACYSDVNAPSLQTEAFETALNEAYAGGILDIQTVTSFSAMTNQKIIYRYNGTAAGKQKGLYYFSALSESWVLIGSEIQKVSVLSQMTDTNDIYKYIGTEVGMVQNSLYCYNGTAWVPIGSGVLTAATAALMTNTGAIYKYTGNESGYITNALYYYNGTAWEALINNSRFSELVETVSSLSGNNSIGPADLDQYTDYKLINSSGVWESDGETFRSALVPIPESDRPILVNIQAPAAISAKIGFISGEANEVGDNAVFSAYFNTLRTILSNTSSVYLVYPDVKYLYVLRGDRSSQYYTPPKIEFIINGTETKVDALYNEFVNMRQVTLSDYLTTAPYNIESSGTLRRSQSPATSFLIPLDSAAGKVRIVANQNGSYISILNTDNLSSYANARAPFISGAGQRMELSANEDIEIELPIGIDKYLFALGVGLSDDYTPQEIYIEKVSSTAGETNGNRQIPTRPQYLSYKRWQQFSGISWTAKSAIPAVAASTGIVAGNHVGLPYSSVKEMDKYIGFNVSIKTFMTAVNNPYSLLYTEDVLGTRSKSGYGFTYHGINCGAYFGIVCNVFLEYIIGMIIDYNTAEFEWLAEQEIFERIYDQSGYGVDLCDIIWEPGHGNVIIDIFRDDRGQVTNIVWAESVQSFPVYHNYTVAQFESRLKSNGGIIYRYKDLYKSIKYTPSEFVAAEGETIETPYSYNDDICTYAGDYACFFDGEPVHINYVKGSYSSMELYKGDALIQTIALPSSYNSTHSVEVTNYLTGYGKYKARLTDGTNASDYTYFEVVDCNVTANVNNNELTVTFGSNNGTPLYVQVTDRAGRSKGIRALTAEEISAGTVTYNAQQLAIEQSYTLSGTAYVKVFFVADYGTVRNDWLEVTF